MYVLGVPVQRLFYVDVLCTSRGMNNIVLMKAFLFTLFILCQQFNVKCFSLETTIYEVIVLFLSYFACFSFLLYMIEFSAFHLLHFNEINKQLHL